MAATTERASGQDYAGPRLGDVLTSLAVIDLVCAPRGLDVVVGEPVIHDPVSPEEIDADAIVLGVGAVGAAARELVARAGTSAAAAVVLRCSGTDPGLAEAAEREGVALLGLPPEMTWSQAHSLVRTAVANPGAGVEDAALAEGQTLDPVPLGDLFALANAVAAMVGGPVTIEDRRSHVLAYSSLADEIDEPRRQTILGRQVPPEWLERLEEAGVFRRLWSGEVVRYHPGPGFELQPRMAVAVKAGDVILGSIWVAEGAEPLGPRAEEALREAARIAALHFLRHRESRSLERATRGELLRSLLEGTGPVEAVAYRLGVRSDDTFVVLAFEPRASDEVEGALERERALDLVSLYGEAFRQRSAPVQIGRTIYVLLPGPDPERLLPLARDIVARARESLGVRLRAGVGSIVDHLRDAPRSRVEADRVLRALDPEADIGDLDGTHERIVLVELRDFLAERTDLRSRALAVLARHDADQGTAYVPTLGAFLDAFGDIPRAARLANVHPNTFRYRLRRLAEVSGIDLADPTQRLLAELDLRLGFER